MMAMKDDVEEINDEVIVKRTELTENKNKHRTK